MNKKLQVFVSSTYTDLIEERQAAVEAILDAGHIPAGMELFKAGKSQMRTIQKWIDESDVYMLILGGRYGSIEEDSGLSYTELEYRYALSKNMPVFAIVLDKSFLHTKAATEGEGAIFENINKDKYEVFKKTILSNIVKFVHNVDQIPSNIHSQLNHILLDPDHNLVGWVRSQDNASMLYEGLAKPKSEEMFGKYTFSELSDIFSKTKLHDDSFNIANSPLNPLNSIFIAQDVNDSKHLALNIFIRYYDQFCSGVSHKILPNNSWLYKTVCPFFEEYKLIEKNPSLTSVYQISKYGRLFYKKLKSEHYI